ncbi:ABC transporter ATP-binding protein [Sansalvadorimonas verongulae]|uniref:ABC transporter ATP-binding protein n=1 Tax=Sansalvadorimonas verongulae TaxID=2172824 RepID=UPI0018AD2C3F|nr:ABC transporter transmembrane domain-containing protein [Sansalvadorimonas verongulae]
MKTSEKRQHFIRLLRYGLPYRGRILVSFIMLLTGTTATLYAPVLVKEFIDGHVVPGNWEQSALVTLGVTFIAIYIIAGFMSWWEEMMFQRVALSVVHDVRRDVFHHLFLLPMAYFDKEPVGKLVSRITNDTETIRDLFVQALPSTVRGIVTLVGVLIAMSLLDLRLALFCMAILPVIFGGVFLYQRYSHPIFHRSRSVLSDINTRINESIQGMAAIQALGQQKRVNQQFGEVSQEYREVQSKLVLVNGLLLRPMVHLTSALALALVVGGFTGQALTGPVEIGLLYAFINYLDRMFEPLTHITMQMQVWQQSVVSAERVFQLMDEPVDNQYDHNATGSTSTEEVLGGKIEFREVGLSYDGKQQALDDISFTVESGQFVALVGHTGSGKSSIVNLLMRFYPYQKGAVLVDDKPLESFAEEPYRRQVGLIFQEPFVFQGTIAENIHLGHCDISEEAVREAAGHVQASGFIEKLPDGFQEVLGERGQSLSSGEKQLLSFARTLAQNPRILIMDEATANIDSETEQAIKSALFTLRQGRTTLAIAHRLTTIEDADLILVLEKGRIVQRGHHRELLKRNGLYRDMYQAQSKVVKMDSEEQLIVGA